MDGVNGQNIPRAGIRGSSNSLSAKMLSYTSFAAIGICNLTRQSFLSLLPDHLALACTILESVEIPAPVSLPRVLLNMPPPTFLTILPMSPNAILMVAFLCKISYTLTIFIGII